MGAKPSVPVAAAEPKVNIDSPTTIQSSSGFHLLELHGPTISAMFLWVAALLSTASLVLFIYRAISKRRRRKEARIEEEARKDNITFRSPPTQTAPYRWSPAGPTAQDHHVLPILLSMARKIEEGEFRRGAGRLTEVWDGQSTIPHLTPLATGHPKQPKRGLEEELEDIVTGVTGTPTTIWEDGETAPKRLRSGHPPLQ